MVKSKFYIERPQKFKFPVPMYYLARFFYNRPKFNLKLSKKETKKMQQKIANLKVEKPIYV
ncbi:MAG: hypothetical protein ACFFDS_10040, partial [Candidatus Thorarchaeota archaeon]